ncbi:hypothetical protein GGF46_000700 [Coemansia sp. RSA 552]|nr:hypothetical protein GGF46_000700 [Coemansia sp. RSA 552]
MTVSRWSMADAPATEDTFAPRWSMFKCKGAANLHIVSVPASVSSINHKDAFLFYPCLIHSPDPRRLSAASCSQIEDRGSGLGGSGTARDRLHGGTLLSQEYNRRKSVCSLASCVIYVWLGAHSSAIKRDAVTRVAMEVRDKELMGKASVLVIDESASANSARRKFLTQLYLAEHGERLPLPKELAAVYSQITPLSMAGDDMDFERALQRRKVVYGFWESISPATILSAGAYVNAAALLKVPAGGAVVLDTWTDVFVWWRNEPSSPAVRRCAANFAAMLVKDTCIPPRPASASVWHEIHGSEHVIFKTKFPDWPFVFASPTGPAEAVRQVAPTSGTALPPAALPTRSISRSALPVAVA